MNRGFPKKNQTVLFLVKIMTHLTCAELSIDTIFADLSSVDEIPIVKSGVMEGDSRTKDAVL